MIGSDIQQAKHHLDKGELVAIPTETVYGLAGNALIPEACTEIFNVKKRPAFDPLIIHCPDVDAVIKHTSQFPDIARKLADRFWPGSLTMVLPKADHIPSIVTSGLDTVAVRIPNHPLTLELLENLDYPLAAPSANPFGYVSPTTAQHVATHLGNDIPYILDGGACTVGIESTIVTFDDEQVIVLRKGGISVEELESVCGQVEVKAHSSSQPKAPGMLKKHYSPAIPLVIGNIEQLIQEHQGKKIATLSFDKHFEGVSDENQLVLSQKQDLKEAAHHLFSYLRKFDTMDVDIILAELVPEKELGLAINDRIRRAAAK